MQSSVDRRIFVVGVPRSGTTLVQSLLATHPAVTSFTESHFFSRHFRLVPGLSTALLVSDPVPRLRQFLDENGIDDRGQAAIIEDEAAGISVPRLLRPLRTRAVARKLLAVLDRIARDRVCPNWVEKTSQHLHYVPFLVSLHAADAPRAHVVHVIRDGLEVVSSLYRASQSWESRRYPFALGSVPPYDLDTCVHRWNRDVGRSLKRVGSANDHFVFYEDLTDDPEAAMRRLLGELGLSWEAAILESYSETAKNLIASFETWKGVDATMSRSGTAFQTLTEAERQRVSQGLRQDLYRRLHARAGARRAA